MKEIKCKYKGGGGETAAATSKFQAEGRSRVNYRVYKTGGTRPDGIGLSKF